MAKRRPIGLLALAASARPTAPSRFSAPCLPQARHHRDLRHISMMPPCRMPPRRRRTLRIAVHAAGAPLSAPETAPVPATRSPNGPPGSIVNREGRRPGTRNLIQITVSVGALVKGVDVETLIQLDSFTMVLSERMSRVRLKGNWLEGA